MANIEEKKVIWTNPDAKLQEARTPQSFRLPNSTIETLKRIGNRKGLSQADIIIRAVQAYAVTALLLPDLAKEVKEVIDAQVSAIDYEFGCDDMPDDYFQYRQMLFKWSEELENISNVYFEKK